MHFGFSLALQRFRVRIWSSLNNVGASTTNANKWYVRVDNAAVTITNKEPWGSNLSGRKVLSLGIRAFEFIGQVLDPTGACVGVGRRATSLVRRGRHGLVGIWLRRPRRLQVHSGISGQWGVQGSCNHPIVGAPQLNVRDRVSVVGPVVLWHRANGGIEDFATGREGP